MQKKLLGLLLIPIMFSQMVYGEGQLDVSVRENNEYPKNDYKTQVDKQIMIVADVANNQDRLQSFAYIVQIKNEDDVTVSLSWLTGMLSPFQTFSPAQSWIPSLPGKYNVEIFVWSGIDNPDALSPPLTMTINVDSSKI